MTSKLIRTVDIEGGEIAVYRDQDGYHAERWDEARQMIVAQSGDKATEAAAVAAVTPLRYEER